MRSLYWTEDEVDALLADREKLVKLLNMVGHELASYEKLMAAIPPCPEHGADCIAHAIDWVLHKRAGGFMDRQQQASALRRIEREIGWVSAPLGLHRTS